MSKLGANETNKNYFSKTEEEYQLTKIILKEMYSKEISDVGMDLLYNGSSTLFEIQTRLKLNFENVRNYLIIMLQNNLIKKKTITNKIGTKLTYYELKFEQIINILFFPRTLNFIEKKYGPYGKIIFQSFIEMGVLTLEQIVEEIQSNKNNLNGNNSEVTRAKTLEILNKLYEDNLIAYSERAVDDEIYYSPSLKSNNLFDKKEEITKITKKSGKKIQEKKGKIKKKNDEKEKIKNKNINIIEDEEEEEERIMNLVDKNLNKKGLKKYEEFYENNTKNNMHFYINFEQIKVEFLSVIVIDFISNTISLPAAIIAGELLKNHKISAFSLGMTDPVQIEYLAKTYKSISFNQIEELIKNHNEIFIKSSSDEIFLNLNKLKKQIKSKIIQNIIISRFSEEHFRVYNMLNLIGSLDTKTIGDLCLIVPKTINLIVNQLLQERLIQDEYIYYNAYKNKTNYYSVNEYLTTENILNMDYKIILNYISYYINQYNNIKNKYKENNKQKEDLTRLTFIVDQLCENILIMKFF